MSFMLITCPWCGEQYTFGVVGVQVVGTGHHCEAEVPCAHKGAGCQRRARFQTARGIDPQTWWFVCEDHIEGGTIVGCQPEIRAAA